MFLFYFFTLGTGSQYSYLLIQRYYDINYKRLYTELKLLLLNNKFYSNNNDRVSDNH